MYRQLKLWELAAFADPGGIAQNVQRGQALAPQEREFREDRSQSSKSSYRPPAAFLEKKDEGKDCQGPDWVWLITETQGCVDLLEPGLFMKFSMLRTQCQMAWSIKAAERPIIAAQRKITCFRYWFIEDSVAKGNIDWSFDAEKRRESIESRLQGWEGDNQGITRPVQHQQPRYTSTDTIAWSRGPGVLKWRMSIQTLFRKAQKLVNNVLQLLCHVWAT